MNFPLPNPNSTGEAGYENVVFDQLGVLMKTIKSPMDKCCKSAMQLAVHLKANEPIQRRECILTNRAHCSKGFYVAYETMP